MEVKFAPSFGDSLKTLIRHETWWYKIYETFRYNIPRFIKNIWLFKKAIWEFRDWDRSFNIMMFRTSLEATEKRIRESGFEVDESRLKKCDAMKRAIEIMKHTEESNHLELAEAELGELHHLPFEFIDCEDQPGYSELVDNGTPEEKEHNNKIYDRAREIEEEEWKELWKIIQGQDYKDFDRETMEWDDFFDGTGLMGWWD